MSYRETLGSGYLHPISELSDYDSMSAPSSALLEGKGGYSKGFGYAFGLADSCRWFLSSISEDFYLFYFLKMYSS